MLSEEVTVEVPKLNLPPDLLAEVARRNNGKQRQQQRPPSAHRARRAKFREVL
jgi:hypothetical protein